MTDVSNILPNDIDALRAPIAAARADQAAAMSECNVIISERGAVIFERSVVIVERNAILAERNQLAARNQKLEAIIAEIRRAHSGRKSERISEDQLALALEELETTFAKAEAAEEKTDPAVKTARAGKRRRSRDENINHLPHEEVVIERESKVCPCCGGALHVIGEDVSKRLDRVPAKLRVVVTRRPKYGAGAARRTAPTTSPG